MKNMISKFQNANLLPQFLLSVSAFLLYGFSSSILDASYQASKFPVPYFIGQTSFDAQKIKTWYQYMIDSGTFDIYLKTQFIDFLFIASVMLGGFFIWTLVSNLHPKDSFFRKWGYWFAFALPLAGLFDVFENLISFFMIANPQNFSNGIVIIYSAFAVLKFAFWGVALLWLVISLITLCFNSIKRLTQRLSVN